MSEKKDITSQDSNNRKIFVGGLSWNTTEDSLREHFSQFGEVNSTIVMMDTRTGRPRGFGFVEFKTEEGMNTAAEETNHVIDGRRVDVKKAVPKEELANKNFRTKKIFVGGLSWNTTEESFREFFEQFGEVTKAEIMYDKQTNRPRGFGFITFESEDHVEKVMEKKHLEVDGKLVEVKKAEPRTPFAMFNPFMGMGFGGFGGYEMFPAGRGYGAPYDSAGGMGAGLGGMGGMGGMGGGMYGMGGRDRGDYGSPGRGSGYSSRGGGRGSGYNPYGGMVAQPAMGNVGPLGGMTTDVGGYAYSGDGMYDTSSYTANAGYGSGRSSRYHPYRS